MKISEIMSRDVYIANPADPLRDVARCMGERDIGFVPVGEDDRLVGTITDRDIVVRALANGGDGSTRAGDVMTADIKFCYEDEDVDHVMENMGSVQVRRLPVVTRDKRLVGVVSLGDAALHHDPVSVGLAMSGISEPNGQSPTRMGGL